MKNKEKTTKALMTTVGGILTAISVVIIPTNPILAAVLAGLGGLLGGGALINVPKNKK